jgi:hypothetical protein
MTCCLRVGVNYTLDIKTYSTKNSSSIVVEETSIATMLVASMVDDTIIDEMVDNFFGCARFNQITEIPKNKKLNNDAIKHMKQILHVSRVKAPK